MAIVNLSVDFTGYQDGMTLIGIGGCNKGVTMRIHGDSHGPSWKVVQLLLNNSRTATEYYNKLGAVEPYSSMSIADRKEYISTNGHKVLSYLYTRPDIRIEILNCNWDSGFISKLDDERKTQLGDLIESDMSVHISAIAKIFRSFQDETFSDKLFDRAAKVNTLAFFATKNWKINTTYKLRDSHSGTILDTTRGTIVTGMHDLQPPDGQSVSPGIYVIDFNNAEVGLFTHQDILKSKKYSYDDGYSIISEVLAGKIGGGRSLDKETFNIIKLNLSIYGASGLKSVLQKCVRYNSKKVSLTYTTKESEGAILATTAKEKILVDTDIFSICSWWALYISPGSLNPNIQRFVTGKESAFKRLAVTILEDGYYHDPVMINMLLFLALVCQKVFEYKANKPTLVKCMEVLVTVINNSSKFDVCDFQSYDTKKIQGDLSPDLDVLSVGPILLKYLGSFDTDIKLFMSAEANSWSQLEITGERPEIMALEHAIDHHCFPQMIYFSDLDWFRANITENSSKVASDIFALLWDKLSKINWRNDEYVDMEDEDVIAMRYCRAWLARSLYSIHNRSLIPPKTERPAETDNVHTIEYTLDDSWLAGMIGTIRDQDEGWMMTVKPDNLQHLIFSKIPKKNMESATLSSEELRIAEREVHKRFPKGVKIDNVPCSWMRNTKVSSCPTDDGRIYKFLTKDNVGWEDAKHVKNNYKKLTNGFDLSKSFNYLVTQVEGIVPEPDFSPILEKYTKFEIARAVAFLYSDFTTIKVPGVARDGGGTKLNITKFDVGAFQVLHQLTIVYPSIIVASSLTTFTIRDPIGLIILRETMGKILSLSRDNTSADCPNEWGTLIDSKGRTLLPHQTKAIQTLTSNFQNGKKGSFVWLTLGSGKSLIVLRFFAYLNSIGKLPNRILYTLPAGALTSLAGEISMMGFNVVLLSPVLRKANSIKVGDKIIPTARTVKDINKFTVMLIEHDHLRKISDELVAYMPDTIMVVDEVHKGLGDTLRTSALLNCALLSYHFVAMTGTPTVDSNTSKLIPWLKMISNYPVSQRNHLVAINSMISDSVNVGKRVEERIKISKILRADRKKYEYLLPERYGGANRGHITQSILNNLMQYCYNACDVDMINDAAMYIKKGRGVFIVAKDNAHQDRLLKGCNSQLPDVSTFCITNKASLNLTDDSVALGQTDYKIVITTMNRSEGYTLTRLSVMLSSVYFSNEASRTQMRGRINRIGQNNDHVNYVLYMAGLLEEFHNRYKDAKNVTSVLASMVD